MDEVPISRLRWQCRRGMKELDVLMEQYLATRYPQADASEQQAFRDVLAMEDPEIYAICVRRMAAPAHLQVIFDQLQVAKR